MPKLPTREELGPLPQVRPGRAIAQADVSAPARAQAELGRTLVNLGSTLGTQAEQQDQFDTERRYQEFKWNEQQGLDQAMREVQPGGAEDFAKTWQDGYQGRAKDFFKTVPPSLKGQYDNKLFNTERTFTDAADGFGRTEQKRYSLQDLQTDDNQYFKRAEAGEPLDGVKQDYRARIDTNPYLTPIEKDDLYRKGQGDLEKLNIRGRIARGDDVEDVLRDMNALPAEVGKTKGLVQAGNIDLPDNGAMPNARPVKIGTQYVLLPSTGPDGKALSDDDAVRQFNTTQQHLGIFDNEDAANAYAHASGAVTPAAGNRSMALITSQLETSKSDPLKGVANISKDSGNTKSYGNFGLNSGGSLQEFMSEYGSSLDIAGKPGSAEFDRNWKAFAAAEPEQLHAAEMQWYQENILPRISGDLKSAGVPDTVSGDPRVQAYIADRLIQYGPESIKTYGQRISRAADAADGDPVRFIQKLGQFDKANLTSDFATFLDTVPQGEEGRMRALTGLGNRVANRERLSLAAQNENVPSGFGGAYPNLSVKDRSELLNVVKTAYREQTMQDLRDSFEQIRRTGKPPVDDKGRTALDRMKYSLTPNQQTKERLKWEEADAEYKAVAPLTELTPTEARDHLDAIRPSHTTDTDHYAIASRVQQKAQKEWDHIQDLREKDPAKAVDGSPEVAQAKQALNLNGQSATPAQQNERLIEARKAAQTRLQIPDFRQRIITKAEAGDLLQMPANPESPDEVEAAVRNASGRAKQLYGRYAPDAMDAAIKLYLKGSEIEKQTARDLADQFRAQETKPAAPPASQSWSDWLFGGGQAAPGKGAVAQPSATTPNQQQIDWALADRQNRQGAFDQKFGAGAFAKAQAAARAQQQQQPTKAR